ncbi:MAG TPA: sigma-70 family RNA polymerase sigma factor [Bryobacteraceae bacterium]|nr:sigma-70 family RNA polymerase sigma factor [Bryobacteraceae bacterium]
MDEHDWLAERFEENRGHMRAVAYRILGSAAEADDAIQEAWLRLNRSDAGAIENLGGWLTTVVARVSLDMLRSRSSRREESLDDRRAEHTDSNLEQEMLLADSVGSALLVVLGTLAPAERVAFVLHDLFAVSFEEIGPIVGRSAVAARQLASRARRRIQGADTSGEADRVRQRQVVDAFLAAAREGDFNGLLTVLDPDVVLRADLSHAWLGGRQEIRGAQAVANTFNGRAKAALRAVVSGGAGAAWAPNGKLRVAFGFTIENGKIVEIELIGHPERLPLLDITILSD